MKKAVTKKLTLIIILLAGLLSNNIYAQAPQAIPYQGVARNAAGNILASQPIGLLINIRDVTNVGTIAYSETQTATTSTLGLFTVNIGTGTPVTGTLAGVNWGTGAKFIQVEMDATGGTNYVNMGTTQLMSVPYALFAGNGGSSGSLPAGTATGNTLHWNGSAWVADNTIYNDGTKVGMGNITPNAFFNVAAGQTVLFGTDTTSTGNKLMWLPTKGAFRTGYYPNSTNDPIGLYSTAMGYGTASGDYSTAMGGGKAFNYASTAMGASTASGNYSTAMGQSSAEGQYSTTMGNNTVAYSPNETVIGAHNDAGNTNRLFEIGNGTSSSALSNAVTVLTNGMVGIGTVNPNALFNVAAGQTVLFGTDTTSAENKLMWLPTKGAFRTGYYPNSTNDPIGPYSTAMGYYSIASGNYSTAMGNSSLAMGTSSTAMGNSHADGTSSTSMGNGHSHGNYSTSMSNGYAYGIYSTAMGNSYAGGNYSTAMGVSNANADYSTSMGNGTNALSNNETVIGTYNDQNNTNRLFEIGDGTSSSAPSNALTVLNNGMVGIGTVNPNALFNVAAGQTVLFGTDTTSAENKLMWLPTKGAFRAGHYFNSTIDPIGVYSTAVGNSTASGDYSTAMGGSRATGFLSTAMNSGTASGNYSTAMGVSKAEGQLSTTMGNNTDAKSVNELVIGIFNDNSNTNRLFEIGDGTSPTSQSNAVTVLNNGNVGIGTVNPNALLNVAEGQTVLFGTDTTSAENKLMWLPSKGAFRAGYYNGSTKDPIGLYSTAMGFGIASGDYSTAMGLSYATGTASTAMGTSSAASGMSSTAMGTSDASGDYSTAMGYSFARGNSSTAMGFNSIASGDYSTAIGGYSVATANSSTALGYSTTANSVNETVIGVYNDQTNTNRLFEIGDGTYTTHSNALTVLNTGMVGIGTTNPNALLNVAAGQTVLFGTDTTSAENKLMWLPTKGAFRAGYYPGSTNDPIGLYSTATGNNTIASGDYSTAMGNSVSTNGFTGSYVIGDSDPLSGGTTNVSVADQFVARFNGGYYLETTSNATRTGVYMNSGDNSWSAISDSTKKENKLTIDGEDFLHKISQFKLGTWNYKGQDPKLYRHYGPMAQDFHNAFGKDALGTIGCDTLINQQDFLGVSFIAIQALEKRTEKIEALQKKNTAQQEQIDQLQQNNLALQQQMQTLLNTVATLNKQVQALAARTDDKNTIAVNK